MTTIQMKQLHKKYGSHHALKGIDLSLPKGSLFGFIGPNGAGKTTTIRLLLGMLRPTSGQVRIFGENCWRGDARLRKRVGYLPGDLKLPTFYSVAEAAGVATRVYGRPLEKAFHELAEYFELDPEVPVARMSRGMRQKLGIIMALAHDPELLVLDEPTTALDPLVQGRLTDLLRRRAANGATVFFSSHVLGEVSDLCRRVGIIRAGTLVADEPLDQLRKRARRRLTIVWAEDETPPAPPDFLTLEQNDGRGRHYTMEGDAPALLAWLRDKKVDDLSLSEPDLDDLFRSYYREEAP
ncbi:MAG: ABC transporter ATP-binding protein [Acidobacteriota bacterium]|nr:ABC transporter ATP-binding protein [Acidobacteriota bacterium]